MVRPSRDDRFSSIVNVSLMALSFALLTLVVWQNRVEFAAVFSRPLDLRLLGLAFLISQVGLLITFLRWFTLVRVIEPAMALRTTLVLGYIGYVFNLVIPGAVGGDLIKVAYLARMHIRKTQVIASMVIDRILGLLGLFVLASAGGAYTWGQATPGVRRLIMAAWIALALGGVALLAIFSRGLTVLSRGLADPKYRRLSIIIVELRTMSAAYRGRLGTLLAGLGLSVIGHTMNVLVFFLIGRMLFANRMTTTLAQHFVMVPLIFFTTAFPLPFGALGLSEEVSGQLFKLVDHPSGALAMIGIRVLALGSGLMGGCVYLVNLNEIRALTRSARPIETESIDVDRTEESVGQDHLLS
jgi:uncharacterized membrane protein YbhN (UPF0104 family)